MKLIENEIENSVIDNEIIGNNNVENNETLENEIEDEVNDTVENDNTVEDNINNVVEDNETVGDNENVDGENNETGGNESEEDNEEGVDTERVIIVEHSATANSIPNAVITRNDKVITGSSVIATGDIASMGDTKYTIVKKGDSTGDGYIKANDYLIIKDYIMETGTAKLEGAFKMAADVTGDNQVKANDYLKIKDHIMYGIDI